MKKRMTMILVAVTALAMLIGFTHQMSVPAYAAEDYGLVNGISPKADGATIWLGDDWMHESDGAKSNRPYTWRIIGENDSNWLLISAGLIRKNTDINSPANWNEAQGLCETLFTDHFTAVEQAAVPTTVKNEPAGYFYPESAQSSYYNFSGANVNAKLFLMSAEEAETYFTSTEARMPGPWWLRSPVHYLESGNINNNYRAVVQGHDGTLYYSEITNTQNCGWLRPAFQIDRSAILFVSNAEDGKPSGEGADALEPFKEADASEWKMTLKDAGRKFALSKVRVEENAVTVAYKGAETGDNEYISAIIKDSEDHIKYYGRIAKTTGAAGEVTINTSGKLGENDMLYVFNEQYNGDKMSDCVSELKEVMLSQSITVDVGADHGTAAEDLKAQLEEYAGGEYNGVDLPEEIEISIDENLVHIDFPLHMNINNGFIRELLERILTIHMDDIYGEDRSFHKAGYQSTYDSLEAYNNDLEENDEKELEDGQTFYVIWEKPIKTVKVTVTDAPVCGDTVTGDSIDNQDPKPVYTIEGEGIDHPIAYWCMKPSLQEGRGVFLGTVNGGDNLYVCVTLPAKFGYYFDSDNTESLVNGSKADDSQITGQLLTLIGTIPVNHKLSGQKRVDKAATCTEAGEKSLYCTVCGEKDPDSTEEIPPLGHDWSAWMKLDDSCHQRVCANDGTHVQTQDHIWDGGIVTKEPTTTAEGVKTYTCTACKATRTEPVPKKDKEPGSDVGPGASAEEAEEAITKMKTDTDPKGSVYARLKLRSPKQTKTSIRLNWTGVSKAKKYVVYGNRCGKTNKPVRLTTVTGKTLTFKKVKGKKIKKGTYYKFLVVAIDKNNKVLSTSKIIHVATKGGKIGNHKKVTVKKSILARAKKLGKGKSLKLNARAIAQSKKLKVRIHVKIRYESTNEKIATVTKKGVVKAKNKGTCYIYAFAQNGVFKKIKVTVK